MIPSESGCIWFLTPFSFLIPSESGCIWFLTPFFRPESQEALSILKKNPTVEVSVNADTKTIQPEKSKKT